MRARQLVTLRWLAGAKIFTRHGGDLDSEGIEEMNTIRFSRDGRRSLERQVCIESDKRQT